MNHLSMHLAVGASLALVFWALGGLGLAAVAGTGSLMAQLLFAAWQRLHRKYGAGMLFCVVGLWLGNGLAWSIEQLFR